MDPRTIDANKDTIIDAGPVRIHLAAIEASLVFWQLKQFVEDLLGILEI